MRCLSGFLPYHPLVAMLISLPCPDCPASVLIAQGTGWCHTRQQQHSYYWAERVCGGQRNRAGSHTDKSRWRLSIWVKGTAFTACICATNASMDLCYRGIPCTCKGPYCLLLMPSWPWSECYMFPNRSCVEWMLRREPTPAPTMQTHPRWLPACIHHSSREHRCKLLHA